MTLNELMALGNVTPELSEDMLSFEMLCRKLCETTDSENDSYMSGAIEESTAISIRKVELLEDFESRAHDIFAKIKEVAPTNFSLQAYFITAIQEVQRKLRVNTSLQLHAMTQIHQRITGQEAGELCH